MSLLKSQTLDLKNDGSIILINKMNNDELLRDNYETRKQVGKGLGNSLMRVASLDVVFLENDPKGLGQKVLMARSGTPEFRIALREFLAEYPEYRTSDAKI